MKSRIGPILVMVCALYALLALGTAQADEFSSTVDLFKGSKQSRAYFDACYGYAVFPTIGKAGFGVGGAYGKGRVYEKGVHVGDTSMTQLSVGFQAGGQAYSQIVFFQDARALGEFTSGTYELGADVGAVAVTAAASAHAGSTGTGAAASGGKKDAATAGKYHKGMAIFTIAKGGAMYEASVAGQKFSFKPIATK